MKNMSSYLPKRLNCGFVEKLSAAPLGDVLTPLTALSEVLQIVSIRCESTSVLPCRNASRRKECQC